MMRIYRKIIGCMVASILLVITSTYAQRKVEFTIVVEDNSGVKIPIILGVDDRATDSLDSNLGEQFLPPFHPPAPSAIHAVVLVENQFCNKSYRRILNQNKFSLEYTIKVNHYSERNAPFFFTWEYPFPEYIDSAKIMDGLGGVLYSFPLDSTKKSILITNEGLVKYNLVLWYNLPPVSVYENEQEPKNENISIEYNKESGELIVSSKEKCLIQIYNSLANKLWAGDLNVGYESIKITSFASGVYFVIITDPIGTITTKRFMISR
ncbi:MAG: hypothetical protein IPM69_09855 [Ignavibacteria bacterium]|nr:hypothetical protein [Ignavibacteria bacterium]